jgi:5-formyltetrahydrofolate cyclo-ligase
LFIRYKIDFFGDDFRVQDKRILRKKFLAARAALAPDEVEEKSRKIMGVLFSLEELLKAQAVMFYVDARNEVKTKDAITWALNAGKRVAVPKVTGVRRLAAVEIKSLEELSPGCFGILEPVRDDGISPAEIDLVIVPGVAFDKSGYRLGYGAGYYDNFLPLLRPEVKKVAVAFEMQVVDRIPAERHDVRMDMIITENCIYRF